MVTHGMSLTATQSCKTGKNIRFARICLIPTLGFGSRTTFWRPDTMRWTDARFETTVALRDPLEERTTIITHLKNMRFVAAATTEHLAQLRLGLAVNLPSPGGKRMKHAMKWACGCAKKRRCTTTNAASPDACLTSTRSGRAHPQSYTDLFRKIRLETAATTKANRRSRLPEISGWFVAEKTAYAWIQLTEHAL